MKIYVNNQNRICAINDSIDVSLTKLELPDNVFSPDITEDLIKCYSCQIDESGNYTIQLLVPPDMAEQINQTGIQRKRDQELMADQLETIVDNDYRLSTLELGLK